jgi:hypothetical protein
MNESSPGLLDALQRVKTGLADAATHFMESANY